MGLKSRIKDPLFFETTYYNINTCTVNMGTVQYSIDLLILLPIYCTRTQDLVFPKKKFVEHEMKFYDLTYAKFYGEEMKAIIK